jgi:hypothetical protein
MRKRASKSVAASESIRAESRQDGSRWRDGVNVRASISARASKTEMAANCCGVCSWVCESASGSAIAFGTESADV